MFCEESKNSEGTKECSVSLRIEEGCVHCRTCSLSHSLSLYHSRALPGDSIG